MVSKQITIAYGAESSNSEDLCSQNQVETLFKYRSKAKCLHAKSRSNKKSKVITSLERWFFYQFNVPSIRFLCYTVFWTRFSIISTVETVSGQAIIKTTVFVGCSVCKTVESRFATLSIWAWLRIMWYTVLLPFNSTIVEFQITYLVVKKFTSLRTSIAG